MKSPTDVLAAIGLTLGGVFGLLGSAVAEQQVRAAAWGLDGAGLVVAASLLAIRYFRRGNDCVAAGFLVFAIGEALRICHDS